MSSMKKDNSNPPMSACPKERNNSGEEDRTAKNPFLLPTDAEIFNKRETSAITSQQVCMKTGSVRNLLKDTRVAETEKSRRDKTIWAAVSNKGHHQKEMRVRDYLIKQREAFMVQHALSVKREIIHNLQKDIETERHWNYLYKKQLEDDDVAFAKFIKETEQRSHDAVNLAERETLVKMEKLAETKKVTARVMAIISEMSKYQDTLQNYQTCRKFLMAVAPAQWHEKRIWKRERKREAKIKERMNEKGLNLTFLSSNFKATGKCDPKIGKATDARRPPQSKRRSATQERGSSVVSVPNEELAFDFSDSDEEPELCFSYPKEMLSALTELEEQSLFYIQILQETEETLDEIRKTDQQTREKMNNEIQLLRKQTEIKKATIQRQKEEASELELKSRIFSYGEYGAEKQDHMLNLLHKKVKEVYRACVGELDSNISTLDMLANIESKVVDVLDRLEAVPAEKVDFVRSRRDKEKRLKIREEQAQLKKQRQKEMLQLTMARALSDSKKRTVRKLMPRSEPLERKKKDKVFVMTTKAQQDHFYFFT